MKRAAIVAVTSIRFAALLIAVCGPFAHADTITTFDVSGSAIALAGQNCDNCAFSGTLAVDVTSGAVTAVDITFPALSSFSTLTGSSPSQTSNWIIAALNSSAVSADIMLLNFTTTRTPGSLVGFTGGSIFGGAVSVVSTGGPLFAVTNGSITAPATVPEPDSLLLVLVGLGALGFVAARRRIPFRISGPFQRLAEGSAV